MQAVPNDNPADHEALRKEWRDALVRAVVEWTLVSCWIAYHLYSRDVVMTARAWSVVIGGGFFVVCVELCICLLIGRDPPKSLTLRLLSLAGVIVLVTGSVAVWVLTLRWLGVSV